MKRALNSASRDHPGAATRVRLPNGKPERNSAKLQSPSSINWKRTSGLQDRIFVQIASYRDAECQWTVKDLFEKATNPERVSVGIVWQYVIGEDDHCFLMETRPEQVRVDRVNALYSKGVCWARARAQQLWQGEEYTLQIDSHMRFEPDWDQKLIYMSRQTRSPKPIITCYPPGYTPPDKLNTGHVFAMGAKEFGRDGTFAMSGRAIPTENAPSKPIPGAFCAAGFFFAPSAIIQEVPYDPHLYFFGEEITLAVRAWTHGWDFFYPNRPIIYTNWDRKYRKTHFEDHPEWPGLNTLSTQRVQYLLASQKVSRPEALQEIEKYGLGAARTLNDYQSYSGVDFAKRTFTEAARAGKTEGHFSRNGKHFPNIFSPSNNQHKPRKVYESAHGIVFDDFLPEAEYQKILNFARTTEYQHINTTGKIQRVWRIRDGFPLRSLLNLHYYSDRAKCPKPKPDWAYPTQTPVDIFTEHLNRLSPQLTACVGRKNRDWHRYSVTSWIYPRDTALSLHDDGSGIYSGAFTYFLSPQWDIHWGGLLMLLDPQASKSLQTLKQQNNVHDYYKRKWMGAEEENISVWEPGLAQCIFPKRNRIAFIHPECYHFVTKVSADAGDNVRMSLAGFFMRPGKS